MENLSVLKKALEKPGIGKRRHDLAESFKGRVDVPLKWVRTWIDAEWYVIGHKYLWLAAMNACIGRPNAPVYAIYKALCKTDPDTFNAAIEACRGLKIRPHVICWWYSSTKVILRIAALTACIDKFDAPKEVIEEGIKDPDTRVRRIAEQILG